MHLIRSARSHVVPALAGFTLVPQLLAGSFATGVAGYNPGTGFATEFGTGRGYTNAAAALGSPTESSPFGPVSPFNPPYQSADLVSVGQGGQLTVSFNSPIRNDAANFYGLDFLIYGSVGFIDDDWPNGRTDAGASTFGGATGTTRVWVSSNGTDSYLLNPALAPTVDGLFPTDPAGAWGVPVNPALGPGDFANRSLAEVRQLYAGSAGGTGYDLSWAQDAEGHAVTLESVSFIRVEVLDGRAEIDAFAAVVPEPAALTGLALLPALAWLRRRTRQPLA